MNNACNFGLYLKKIQKKSPAMKAGAFFVLMNVVISNVLQHFLNLHHLKRGQHIEAKGCYCAVFLGINHYNIIRI